jgi:hypothetical protein
MFVLGQLLGGSNQTAKVCPNDRAGLLRNRLLAESVRSGEPPCAWQGGTMNGVIYLIGLVVVILAILSFLGLR